MSIPTKMTSENKRYLKLALEALEGLVHQKIASDGFGTISVQVLFSRGEIRGVKTSDESTIKEADSRHSNK